MRMHFYGTYYFIPHEIINLKNAPVANGEWMVTNVNLNFNGTLITKDVSFSAINVGIPDLGIEGSKKKTKQDGGLKYTPTADQENKESSVVVTE